MLTFAPDNTKKGKQFSGWQAGEMRRRQFLGLAGAAALARRLPAFAQTTKPVIGFLSSRSPNESRHLVAAFQKGLSETGFTEGVNYSVEYRWADGRYDDLPAMANELVGLGVTAIFTAGGPPSAVAAKAATTTIPIVFSAANDPVRLGLVASLARPGGYLRKHLCDSWQVGCGTG